MIEVPRRENAMRCAGIIVVITLAMGCAHLYSDKQGHFSYDGAALALVKRPSHLQRVYADAARGEARPRNLVHELEYPLTHKEPQALLDKFAGKREPVGNLPRGQPGFKERVDFGEVIGEVGGNPTTKGIIHYSKDGAHIVPANP